MSKLSGHKKSINCIDVSPRDPSLIASASDDGTCRIWDIRTTKSSKCFVGFSGKSSNEPASVEIPQAIFCPKTSHLILVSIQQKVKKKKKKKKKNEGEKIIEIEKNLDFWLGFAKRNRDRQRKLIRDILQFGRDQSNPGGCIRITDCFLRR